MKKHCLAIALSLATPAYATAFKVRLSASQPEVEHTSHVGLGIGLTNGNGLQVSFSEDEIKTGSKSVELASLDVVKSCRFRWTYKKLPTDILPIENPTAAQDEMSCVIDLANQEIVLAPAIRVKSVSVKVLPEAYTRRNSNVLIYRLLVQEMLAVPTDKPIWTYSELPGIAKVSSGVQIVIHSVFYKENFLSYLTPTWLGAGGRQTEAQIGAMNDEITVD